ncbi:MAG: TolC family protein [Lewinellaceae bacterium]|nr:TolC family protein [Phaeodactylibacter sp.]MCB9039351.1 TolC family protein [Lewinellaceae bacterium]
MKAFHLLLALFLLNANIFAQQELSLSQAIETGLQNNYQIQISEARADITANSNDWGVAGRYPTINLTLNSNNSYRDLSNPGSVLRTSNTINTGLAPGVEANWTIFNGYRVRYTKEQLEVQEQLSGGDIRIAVENTIQGVIQAYYNALVQQEQLDVVQEVLELSRDRVEYQELRKEFGQASTFDILQTQDAYLNDSTSYILQGNTFQTAIRNLNLSMGVDDLNTPYRLTDTLTYDVADYQLENLQERMQASNNQLQNQFVNRDLAALNTRIQESTLYPTVQVRSGLTYDVALSTGEQQFSFEMEPRKLPKVGAKTFTGFINFAATYPIFDAGVRRKRIENAKTEELIAQHSISDLKRSLNNQLANTLATYNTQKRLVEVTTALAANARRNLEIAEERFRGGLINSFDYRTIQVSYINASQQRLTALFNLKNTETELIRLIGGLVR